VKILVTGATGFVAGHLVPVLARSHEVIALGHDPARIAATDGVEPLVMDLRRVTASSLPEVDAIVHLAQANVSFPDGARDLHAVNTGATVALLDHARRSGASHFVFASSASIYGLGDRPWTEADSPLAPDFYSATKLAAERFIAEYEPYFASTVMRLVAPFGPGQRNRMIPRIIESVGAGRAITLNPGGRPRMNPIYISDLVRVLESALTTSGSHVVNVAGDDTVSIREIAESAGRAIGIEPVFEEGEAAGTGDIVCANDLMHSTFGTVTLTPFEDGMRRAAEEMAAP
jgi:nucleoside-diphosphate-sugar epimerase